MKTFLSMKFFFIFSVLLLNSLFSDILKHLKTVEIDEENHSIQNIDFIYMINLDERPEKYAMSINELSPYKINPYRFSAINGWKDLTLQDINELGVRFIHGMKGGCWATRYFAEKSKTGAESIYEIMDKYGKVYFGGRATRGVMGCILSHLSILKHAYDMEYETIWVMEDDIKILKDPRQLSSIIEELDQLVGYDGWDILFSDYDYRDSNGQYVPARGFKHRPNYTPKNTSRLFLDYKINERFRRVGARFGAHSMIIRRKGIEKLLNFFTTYHLFHPIDLELNVPDNMRLFTVLDDIVSNQLERITDIAKPGYE